MTRADIIFNVVSIGTIVAPMAFIFAVLTAWMYPDGACSRAFEYVLHIIFALIG